MNIMERLPGLRELSTAEKMRLIDELYHDLSADPNAFPPTPEIIAELDRRMAEYERDPAQVTTWEAIRARLQHKKRGARPA